MRLPTLLLSAMVATPALAHEGHGLFGAHGHASDAWGFVVIGAIAAAAWWAGRGR